jgi:hypothetical protein
MATQGGSSIPFGSISTAAGEQENVAELQFGAEFEQIHILSNAQVDILLQMSTQSAISADEEVNEVYRKTQKYVTRFNSMTNPEKSSQEVVDELDNLQEYVCVLVVLCSANLSVMRRT